MPKSLLVFLPVVLLIACGEPPESTTDASPDDGMNSGHEQAIERARGADNHDGNKAPGNLHRYLNDTHEMVEQKQYSAALKRYIWFHEHVLEHDPSMSGVRLSFALGGWRRLAEVYPPAMEALVETRDQTTARVENGSGGWNAFHDVQSLNESLGDESLTVELFEQLHETRPELAQRVWGMAKSDVITARRYELAKRYIGNPMHSLAAIRRSYERNQTLYGSLNDEQDEDEHFREFNENRFVEETLELMQVYTALGREDLVDQIGNEALKTFLDPRLEYAMEH